MGIRETVYNDKKKTSISALRCGDPRGTDLNKNQPEIRERRSTDKTNNSKAIKQDGLFLSGKTSRSDKFATCFCLWSGYMKMVICRFHTSLIIVPLHYSIWNINGIMDEVTLSGKNDRIIK